MNIFDIAKSTNMFYLFVTKVVSKFVNLDLSC